MWSGVVPKLQVNLCVIFDCEVFRQVANWGDLKPLFLLNLLGSTCRGSTRLNSDRLVFH